MLGVRPNVTTGFAQWPGMSEYPQFWQGLVCAFIPYLGTEGTLITDRSGRGNHGNFVGNSLSWSWKNKFGRAVSMHGAVAGDMIVVPYHPSLNGKRTVLMVWETSNGFDSSNDTNRQLWEQRDTTGEYPGAAAYLNQIDGKMVVYNDPGAGDQVSLSSIQDSWEDETYVTAFTADGTNMSMYINGIFENSIALATAWTDSVNDFRWGMNRNDQYGFVGRVAEMCIFNRALSASEILWHYEQLMRTLTSSSQGMFTNL